MDLARGIQASFWYMIPCAGLSFIITVFFIKKKSLKRDDDAQKKAEAKAWVESKKAKHRRGKGEGEGEKGSKDSLMTISGDEEPEEEANGVEPSKGEGYDQGPDGGKL